MNCSLGIGSRCRSDWVKSLRYLAPRAMWGKSISNLSASWLSSSALESSKLWVNTVSPWFTLFQKFSVTCIIDSGCTNKGGWDSSWSDMDSFTIANTSLAFPHVLNLRGRLSSSWRLWPCPGIPVKIQGGWWAGVAGIYVVPQNLIRITLTWTKNISIPNLLVAWRWSSVVLCMHPQHPYRHHPFEPGMHFSMMIQ